MIEKPKRTDACPRKLNPGELRRMPRENHRGLVGYYLACPNCGFRCLIILEDEFKPVEKDGQLLSISHPCRCNKCASNIGIRDGLFYAA